MPKPTPTAAAPVRFTRATATMVKPGPGVAARAPPVFRATIRPKAASRSAPRRAPRNEAFGWLGAHKSAAVVVALLVATAAVGIAAVVFGQSFSATPTTRTSPIAFASGDDITNLDTLDFADVPIIGASGATASITIYGIPGATSLSLGEILELVNADTADNQAYAVTLTVSGTPAASLTGFTITFLDDVSGVPTLRTWDLLTTPTLTTYTLSDAETWEFTVSSLLMSAAASGSQGVLTISASMTPV